MDVCFWPFTVPLCDQVVSMSPVVRETPSCCQGPSGRVRRAVIGRRPVVKKLLISGLGLPRPISGRLLCCGGRVNGPGPPPPYLPSVSDDVSKDHPGKVFQLWRRM